jgi:hypothetical protein
MKGDSWQQTTWEDMIIHVSIRRRETHLHILPGICSKGKKMGWFLWVFAAELVQSICEFPCVALGSFYELLSVRATPPVLSM